MTGIGQDVRYSIRGLSNSPGFVLTAIAILAVAIAGTTVVISVVDAVLLRSLPFEEPERLVMLLARNAEGRQTRAPHAVFEAWQDRATTIDGMSTYWTRSGVLRGSGEPVEAFGEVVSANFFTLTEARLRAGRGFLPGEDRPGAEPVMVIGYELWQRALGGDPEAIGRTVYLADIPYLIVGIAEPRFRGPLSRRRKEFWTPYPDDRGIALQLRFGVTLVARLANGKTREEAQAELEAIARSVEVAGESGRFGSIVQPLHEHIVGDSRLSLMLLFGAVAAVLLIACANLAQLLLARADRKTAEYAARKALGAPASRLFRQNLTESLLLSTLGGVAGVLLAYWSLPVVLATAPTNLPRIGEAAIDGRVLAAALIATTLSGCLFGAAPAWRLARAPLNEALKRGGAGMSTARGGRSRSILLAAQVAASIVLLVVSGLFLRTFLNRIPTNLGFASADRSWIRLARLEQEVPELAKRLALSRNLAELIGAVPGVDEVAQANHVPFSGSTSSFHYRRRDADTDDPDNLPRVHVRAVSPTFFRLMEMPLTAGRLFEASDGPGAPGVAIANQTLARKLAPGGSALGIRLHLEDERELIQDFEIVGVVADARYFSWPPVRDGLYLPFNQGLASRAYFVMRSTLPAESLTPSVHAAIRRALPSFPLEPIETMDSLLRRSVAGPRFQATLLGVFAANALALAALGLFGAVAYGVTRRRRELGVRAAMGAQSTDLVSTVMRPTIVAVVAGLAAGLVLAGMAGTALTKSLYGVEPLDPVTFVLAAAVLLAVAALAAFLPARRAARADPMDALRHD